MGTTWGTTDLTTHPATPDYALLADGDTTDTDTSERRILTGIDLEHLCGLVRSYRVLPTEQTAQRLGMYAPALLDWCIELQQEVTCLEAERSARGLGMVELMLACTGLGAVGAWLALGLIGG